MGSHMLGMLGISVVIVFMAYVWKLDTIEKWIEDRKKRKESWKKPFVGPDDDDDFLRGLKYRIKRGDFD